MVDKPEHTNYLQKMSKIIQLLTGHERCRKFTSVIILKNFSLIFGTKKLQTEFFENNFTYLPTYIAYLSFENLFSLQIIVYD